LESNFKNSAEEEVGDSRSPIYAQELAPVPLQLSTKSSRSLYNSRLKNSRGPTSSSGPEPYFYTTFCNELLCSPRVLHHAPKGNLTVKIEVCKIKWDESNNVFVAQTPHFGPSIHNQRRGPPMVPDAYTSCIFSAGSVPFLNEFKIKLPLLLCSNDRSSLSILFSVYSIETKQKRSWTDKFASKLSGFSKRSQKRGGGTEGVAREELTAADENEEAKVELLGCGFIPLTSDPDSQCLIDDGVHNVKLCYEAGPVDANGELKLSESVILSKASSHPKASIERSSSKVEASGSVATGSGGGHEDESLGGSQGEKLIVDTDEVNSMLENNSLHTEIHGENTTVVSGSGSYSLSETEQSSAGLASKYSDDTRYMSLQVQIVVHSSLHPQNAALREFMCRQPDKPQPLQMSALPPSAPWLQPRQEFLKLVDTCCNEGKLSKLDREQQLLVFATIDVSKSSVCPTSMISRFLLRLINNLTTSIVSGSGEPSLAWSNPAAALPLRTHAFASLLQLLSSFSNFFSRNGSTNLDGRGKWNASLVSRFLPLILDEEQLLSEHQRHLTEEPADIVSWLSHNEGRNSPTKLDSKIVKPKMGRSQSEGRPRHVRSDSDNLIFSSEIGESNALAISPSFLALDLEGSSFSFSESLGESSLQDRSMTMPAGSFEAAISSLKDSSPKVESRGHTENSDAKWTQKIDSRADFESNLLTASSDFLIEDSFSSLAGSSRAGGRRKWMTLPSSALAPIREDLDTDNPEEGILQTDLFPTSDGRGSDESISKDMIKKGKKQSVKQMRIPTRKKVSSIYTTQFEEPSTVSAEGRKVITTDEEIESAGTAFLDVIGENLGYSSSKKVTGSGEEMRVGQAHHRKTRSRCSIDWTLPEDEILFRAENDPRASHPLSGDSFSSLSKGWDEKSKKTEFDLSMTMLQDEFETCHQLSTYAERINLMGKLKVAGRWFPYLYEVIIFQWVALLLEQRRSGEKDFKLPQDVSTARDYNHGVMHNESCVKDAASRARGVAISCAPSLFEIIKKSLGWRIHKLLKQADTTQQINHERPFLVQVDDAVMSQLETLISLVTDACIDSRNFDSWEFRQTSIDVNDSIIRFLRDLFAFLHPESVHRLVLVYFARFVVREGKHWQDRDSKIGLRCSWEICKLRLNAVTALVRFPDFVRVNSPQMASWGQVPDDSRPFFDSAVETFLSLDTSGFAPSDGPITKAQLRIPGMQPHWLAELVVDVSLAGTGHADPYIQHRAASLLHELFWSHSQEGRVNGSSSVIGSMHISFLLKILSHSGYLSILGAKTQLRKDLMPCVIYVLQGAPMGMLHSCWRKLCKAAAGKGLGEKFGVRDEHTARNLTAPSNAASFEEVQTPTIFDVFNLLNLALATFEYDGCEDSREIEEREEDYESSVWMKEYLPAIKQKGLEALFRRSPLARRFQIEESKDEDEPPAYSSTSSRRWQCHDGSSVVINTCRYIVREVLKMSKPSNVELNGNPNSRDGSVPSNASATIEKSTLAELDFSHSDIVAFVRAAASVYLHSLSLRQSDIVCIKTLTAAIELVKIFGIKLFLEAVGETLQHWMRCILTHCGARRAEVRVQALEFLALVLRVTWDSYGSFFRIRVPLLAVQTEVMERIVATAATRYYREQRRISSTVDYLTNDSAEATLSMMWRTLDRLHHQSASQNVAFRSALIRLAQKMKKLYRAYIAAHALAILKRARSPLSPNSNTIKVEDESPEVSAMKQSRRISVHRIILSSAGYSKQFLGLQRPNPQRAAVAHNEAVEDAFLEAADVFSPTELPSHRVAWLQKLAEFHASRLKYAEEATCHFRIYATLRQASRVHECIWSSMPFLPWTSDGGVHIDGEGPAGEPDEYYDSDYYLDDLIEDHGLESHYGRQIEKTNSFRRIFYRVANSVRMRTGDWEMGGNRHLFYGVTLVSEYGPSPPWTTLREMEAAMIEESEAAGELYMKAGITESSRVSWGLATNYYAERHNYSKLCYAYQRLASVMTSHVPVVDTNDMALDFSHPLGRFYRVWFHGGAPEDLIGKEFVYRSPKHIKLDEFGTKLSEMIKSILPDNSPIDLVLDDGRPEDASKWRSNQRRARGVAPLEPVKIKVTPLRPLLKRANRTRGTPEWFHLYTDVAFTNGSSGEKYSSGRYARSNFGGERNSSQYRSRGQSSSSTASVFAFGETSSSKFSNGATGTKCHGSRGSTCSFASNDSELVGVDKFSFLQPIKKDRGRASRDWLKASGDFSEKSLRVTQLQVESSFPACVARQAVLNRTVFTQSPLEAGIDAVCSWCSVLFRTAVATNGMMVLGTRTDHGIGNAAARVVADCIHSSRVKEMGITLLKKNGYVAEESDHYGTMMLDYSKLSEDEVNRLQIKLARGIIVFIEILHLLIARNRNLLLTVVEARKQGENTSVGASRNPSRDYGGVGSPHGERRGQVRSPAWSSIPSHKREISGLSTFSGVSSNVRSVSASGPMGTDTQFSPQYDLSRHNVPYSQSSTIGSVNDRTDSAIAVQSELQRGFISMAKVLHPLISAILQHETPKFLKLCTQDTYFSSNSYRQSKMPMADELCFIAAEDLYSQQGSENGSSAPFSGTYSLVSSAEPGLIGLMHPTPSPVGSMAEGSVASRDARTLNRKKNSESSARMYQC